MSEFLYFIPFFMPTLAIFMGKSVFCFFYFTIKTLLIFLKLLSDQLWDLTLQSFDHFYNILQYFFMAVYYACQYKIDRQPIGSCRSDDRKSPPSHLSNQGVIRNGWDQFYLYTCPLECCVSCIIQLAPASDDRHRSCTRDIAVWYYYGGSQELLYIVLMT